MPKYRADIDGLRAIAVLSIIAYHLDARALGGGFVGVDIFFVISGFLLGGIILNDLESSSFSFTNFYKRRIKRILPAFFAMCFVTLFAALFFLLPNEFDLTKETLYRTAYFFQNHFFASNIGGYWGLKAQDMPLLHTWSLAVEEQFYIIAPVALFVLYKLKISARFIAILLVLAALCSFSLSYFGSVFEPILRYNYYSLPTSRLGELLIGVLCALAALKIPNKLSERTNNAISLTAALGIALCLVFIDQSKILFPSFWAAIPTLFVALLIFANSPMINGGGGGNSPASRHCEPLQRNGKPRSINNDELRRRVGIFDRFHKWIATLRATRYARNDDFKTSRTNCAESKTIIAKILSLSPIVFIGKLSYSLYLWHWPVIVFYKKWHFINSSATLGASDYALMLTITAALAIASYYLIERPCRYNNFSFVKSALLFYGLPAVLIFALHATERHYPLSKTAYAALYSHLYGKANLESFHRLTIYPGFDSAYCSGRFVRNENGEECVFGDLSKAPKVLMLGDSHAGHYAPLVAAAGKKYKFSAKIMSSCIIHLEFSKRLMNPARSEHCAKMIEYFKAHFNEYDTIILGGYWALHKDAYFKLDLEAVVELLAANNKQIIILKQAPMLSQRALSKYFYALLRGENLSGFSSDFMLSKEEKSRAEWMEEHFKDKVIFLDPFSDPAPCAPPFCQKQLMYMDTHHLNAEGIKNLTNAVLDKQKTFWEGILK